MRGKAHRVARLAQTHLQNSMVTGPTYYKCLSGIIGGVNARIHVEILLSVVECQRTETGYHSNVP